MSEATSGFTSRAAPHIASLMRAMLMDGTTLVSGQNVGFNPGTAWHAVNTGDYNADGKADILWQNDDGSPAVWLMDGTTLIGGADAGFNPGSDWHVDPQHHGLLA